MARSRNIKPSFFTNDRLADISPLGRLLFTGLWCLADREGRLEDRPKRIRAEILPYDDCNTDALLNDLAAHGFILRYEAEGGKFIQVISFCKHQNPHHMEVPSEIPPPPGASNKYNHRPVTKEQRQRIFERDDGRCLACGSAENLSIDHIVPVSKGGTSDDANLRTLCISCNTSKGNREQVEDDSSTTRSRTLIPDSGFPPTDSIPSRPSAAMPGFEHFWQTYPNHNHRRVDKSKCLAEWRKQRLEAKASEIVAHAAAMKLNGWVPDRDGQTFEPQPIKYLKRKQWEEGMPQPPKPKPIRDGPFDVDATAKRLNLSPRPGESMEQFVMRVRQTREAA